MTKGSYLFTETVIILVSPLTWSTETGRLEVEQGRLSEERYRYVWACAHVALCGFSLAFLINDLAPASSMTARVTTRSQGCCVLACSLPHLASAPRLIVCPGGARRLGSLPPCLISK